MSKEYVKYGSHNFKIADGYDNNTEEIQLLSEYNQKLLDIIKIDAGLIGQVLDTKDRKFQPRSNQRNPKSVNILKEQIQDSGLSNVPVAFWSDSEKKFKLLTGHHRTTAMCKILNSDEFKDGIPIAISSFKDSDFEEAGHYALQSNLHHEQNVRSGPEDIYVSICTRHPGLWNFLDSNQPKVFKEELYKILDTHRCSPRTKSAIHERFLKKIKSQTFESYADDGIKYSAIDEVLPKLFPNEIFSQDYSKNCFRGSKLEYPYSNGITTILNGTDTALFQSTSYRISEIGLRGSASQNDQVIPIFYARSGQKSYETFDTARKKVLNQYKGLNLVTKKAYINKIVFLPQWIKEETDATIYEWNQKEDRFEKIS